MAVCLSMLILSGTTGRVLAAEKTSEIRIEKPNIVFIMADDLGYGDLGCYGQQQIRTPHIDQMASDGMRFTQFYAGSTVCAPSRCVLMTGLHLGHCYIRGNARFSLRPDDFTVAELLKQNGYRTGMCGKWGLAQEDTSGVPTRQGFDFFFGYLDQVHAHNYYPSFLIRNGERVELSNVIPNEGKAGQGVATERREYSHDLIVREALAFIDRNKDDPFFLYVPFTLPHANNEARNKGMEVPDHGIYRNRDWPEPQKGLAAMIGRLDRDVGAILNQLKEHGIDDRTIVFFTSDNGPHSEGGNDSTFFNSNGPVRGMKRDLYDGGIRVPMIARWPGKVRPGSTTGHISAFWDFLPTACQVSGVDPPEGIDGISYLPTLLGRDDQKKHDYLYWEYSNQRAVRMGPWKALRSGQGKVQLFNLTSDLGESTDVAAKHPAVVRRIEAIMATAHSDPKP